MLCCSALCNNALRFVVVQSGKVVCAVAAEVMNEHQRAVLLLRFCMLF